MRGDRAFGERDPDCNRGRAVLDAGDLNIVAEAHVLAAEAGLQVGRGEQHAILLEREDGARGIALRAGRQLRRVYQGTHHGDHGRDRDDAGGDVEHDHLGAGKLHAALSE
jgi:hypothetical protein